MSTSILLLIITITHQALSIPINQNEIAQNVKINSNHLPPNAISSYINQNKPISVPLQHLPILDTKANTRKKKGPSIPVALPITHQLLLPTQLHVIPIHANIHHNSLHGGFNHVLTNNNVPIISHAIPHGNTSVTHSTSLIPILFPIHHTHLVPLHDLSVIPLHRVHSVETKLNHYRVAMEMKQREEEEQVNRYRSFYGGYGNGLFIGGHGAGHGFYAYG